MKQLDNKKLFLLDMDGTIYLDEKLFEATPEFLRHIRQIGGRYLFLTNNSSKSVDAYVDKLHRLGLPADPEDFLTSVDATVHYLKNSHPNDLIYAFGTAAFRRQLLQAGLRITDKPEEDVSVLLIGFDTELSFQKLEDACILLGRGVDYIATNPDWVCPTWYGYVPDCGSVCEMLYRATGKRPLVIGKPKPEMVLLALEKTGIDASQTVLIGDRVYTDIACGVNAGIDTILVLSGESTVADIEQGLTKPTWVFENIGQVLSTLQREEQS